MGRLITLDIRYDPDYPFDWVPDPTFGSPEPRFPYRGNGRRGTVSVLGLRFKREHVVTRGSDPYAGDTWSLKVGKFELKLSNVVICTTGVRWNCRELLSARGYSAKDLPQPWGLLRRFLWNFLNYRKYWLECNSAEDPMGRLGDYE